MARNREATGCADGHGAASRPQRPELPVAVPICSGAGWAPVVPYSVPNVKRRFLAFARSAHVHEKPRPATCNWSASLVDRFSELYAHVRSTGQLSQPLLYSRWPANRDKIG